MLTTEQIAQALPPNLKSAATQQFTDMVNNVTADPEVAQMVRDNFISFASVLKDGKFRTEDYLNAVTYVSYRMMGFPNQEAYAKTFPSRYQAMVANGTSSKTISTYVSAYNRGKLVNLVLQQSLIPMWVLNSDTYQKAINVQADLMVNATSEKVRTDAANSILTHLKPPEAKEINLNVGVKENSGVTELKNALAELAQKQKVLIESGVSTKDIAAQPIIEAEYVEVDPD